LTANNKEISPFFGVLLGQETTAGWHITGCCHFNDPSPEKFTAQKESVSPYLSGGKSIVTSNFPEIQSAMEFFIRC
jgi:hypothetical protein